MNAGFLFQIVDNKVTTCRICYGGINPRFVHASATEKLLINKELYTNATLQDALASLNQELHPDCVLPDASPEYRKNLALSLFYKFMLNTCPADKVSSVNRSGGTILHRPLSSGTQTFETDKSKWPVNEPVVKYEGLIQCTGEAKFVNDMASLRDELWAAFVPATVVHRKIGLIDATEALVCSRTQLGLRWPPPLIVFVFCRKFQVFDTFSQPKTFRASTASHQSHILPLRRKRFFWATAMFCTTASRLA